MPTYRLYGLTLQSRLALPCRSVRATRPDVRLIAGSASRFAGARRLGPPPRRWFHAHTFDNGTRYLRWAGNFEFLVSRDGHRILYRRLAHATPESLAVHLLGHVLSYSLLARDVDPLHGTVVAVGSRAIALVGDCGRGKSTLAAALLAGGCRVVTDDLVAVRRHRDRWLVDPGIPRLKLAPRLATRLLGSDLRFGLMIHGAAKRVVPLSPTQTVPTRLPLSAIYVLAEPERASGRNVVVEPLVARDAFIEVIRAAFNLVVLEPARHASQFAFARRLAADVPVRRLAYRRDIAELPAVCHAVLADAARL